MAVKQFNISKAEINRRIIAYFSLALTWPLALACASIFLPATMQTTVFILTALIFVAMIIIGATTTYFLRTVHMHTIYEINNATLKRLIDTTTKETVALSKITRIHIKYTSGDAIRQITLTDDSGKKYNIDGAEQFNALKDAIIAACPKARTTTWREPINYDHYLFYPILGIVFAGISIAAVTAISAPTPQLTQGVRLGVFIFCLAVAAYIAVAKPLARQYGMSLKKTDYILAAGLAVAALATLTI